ncbi:MAG TPA: YceI family protein [Bacteroidota bacterium]|nr:YceI family protein [Bacteroidota bacterium]
MNKITSIGLGVVLSVAVGSAQIVTWNVDKAHSHVKFNVSHLVIAEVEGRFKDFDATLTNSKEDFTDAQLVATIKVASIDTDNESRDKHLRSADFLDAEKHPEIIFKSTSFEKAGQDTYKIKGDLTIRGNTKPVILEAKYNGTVTDPWGNTKVAFKATTAISRFDFGTVWDKKIATGGLVAGETVNITLFFEGTKAK